MNDLHVIFGTGPLGMSVMRELVTRGRRVRMVNRSGQANVPAGVEVVSGDAYNPTSTREVTRGAAVAYQCAQPAYTEWLTKFPPLQAGIVEGVSANGVKLIVGDNLYMYGRVNTPMVETMPDKTQTKKGRIRASMAQSLLDAHARGTLRVAIGRASDFYGSGGVNSAVGERVFYPALAGGKVYGIGDLDAPHTYTYVNDFGKALVILGEHDEALGQVWHVPSAPTITTREFFTLVFEEAGQTPNIAAAPKLLMRAMGLFNPALREVLEMMYQFEAPFVVDHAKFARAFGDHVTPHHEAIRQTLAWYRANPQVKNAAA